MRAYCARMLLVLCAFCVYAVSFPALYNSIGAIAAVFSLVPVSMAGVLLGVRGGLLSGLFCIPLNLALFSWMGVSGSYMLVKYWPGTAAYLAAGVTIGWLRDLVCRLKEYSLKLNQEHSLLLREVSERMSIEGDLNAHLHFLQTLIDAIPNPIFYKDVRCVYLGCNDAFAAFVGLRKEEIVGKTVHDISPPDLAKVYERADRDLLESRGTQVYEASVMKSDGTRQDVIFNKSVFNDAQGDPGGLIGTILDITEQKRTARMLQQAHAELGQRVEERTSQLKDLNRQLIQEIDERKRVEDMLSANEQLYRSLVETSPYAITLTDTFGTIVMANSEALSLYGTENSSEVIGRQLMEWISPEERGFASELFSRLCDGETIRGVLLRMVRSGRHQFWAEISASRTNLQGTRDDIVLFHCADVTDRMRAEESLRNSNETLRSLGAYLENVRENERKVIAREIHDDLGQSLTALKYDISWLAKNLPEQTQAIGTRLASMEELVSSTIRTVQRITSELRPRLLDELGLTAAIEWQIQDFTRRTGIPCNMLFGIEGETFNQESSTALFRILQEALTNIIRHASATEIEVSLIRKGAEIVLLIADNGRGLSEKESCSPQSFGLMGMRERALMCGGDLKIVGAAGKGTCIEVSLPVPRKES